MVLNMNEDRKAMVALLELAQKELAAGNTQVAQNLIECVKGDLKDSRVTLDD